MGWFQLKKPEMFGHHVQVLILVSSEYAPQPRTINLIHIKP